MPYATNPLDGVRTYFEDSGGNAPAVLFYTGFGDPLEVAKSSGLARALSGEFRLIFADHRGQGGSDKPHGRRCLRLGQTGRRRYRGPRRVEHRARPFPWLFVGSAVGIRRGRACTRTASFPCPVRQPAVRLEPRFTDRARGCRCRRCFKTRRHDRVRGDLRVGARLSIPGTGPDVDAGAERTRRARRGVAVQAEGPISQDLSKWRVPCLICAGEADEMRDDAETAAGEIPGAKFVSLAGHSHISAFYEADAVLLPHILEQLRSAR